MSVYTLNGTIDDESLPIRAAYQQIIEGKVRSGQLGNVLFCVSTDDLGDAKGDLFVALGLARALHLAGWGVSLWPSSKFGEETPADIDIAVIMLESHAPGLVHPSTKVVAWVRNWTRVWSELPYLDAFSEVWCSSTASAAAMAEVYSGPVRVVPLATDPALFEPLDTERIFEVTTTANFWGVERAIRKALETVAEAADVTWFGTNSRFLQVDEKVVHRDAIDYFELPGVYSGWKIVVDDLIPAAAAYGNHNSRLFDALACGAVVITNSATGLDELGLDDVPVYTDGADLSATVQNLLIDTDSTSDLAAHLREVVLSRHTYAHRAADLTPSLLSLVASEPVPHSSYLRWTTLQGEELRSLRAQRDSLAVWYNDLDSERVRLAAEIEELRSALENIQSAQIQKTPGLVSRVAKVLRSRRAGDS